MSRGVIASPGIIEIQGDGFMMKRGLSQQEIRYYALYWDKVVIPTNNLVHIGVPDEDTLIQSGVIQRPSLGFQGSFNGSDIGNAVISSQAIIAKKLIESDKKTDWVLHQVGNSLSVPKEFLDSKRSLRFELVNLLPVPDDSVAIEEILEFKHRRNEELTILHDSIESLYIEALKNPDSDLGVSSAIREFKNSITNLNTVSDERWNKTSKFDFSSQLNLDGGKLMQSVAGGAAFDFFTNAFTMPVGTIAGGILSVLKLKASYAASFKPAENSSKLSFLSHAHKENILQ